MTLLITHRHYLTKLSDSSTDNSKVIKRTDNNTHTYSPGRQTPDEVLHDKVKAMLATFHRTIQPLAKTPWVAHLRAITVDDHFEAFVDEAQGHFYLRVGENYLDYPLWYGPLPLG